MAGLGRRIFNAGEVLSAANVQGYLQDQVVQVYSGTAARSSALGTAVSEGMVSYLTDTNELSVYTVNGTAAWSPVNLQQSGNAIINGGFDIWQRGTAINNAANDAFTADRWRIGYNGSGATRNISQQTFTPGTAPVAGYEGQFYLRYAQTVAGSGGTGSYIGTRLEDVRTFAGQTVTVSFWAKADAARTVFVSTEQNFGSGGSASVFIDNANLNLTTSWARYTTTISLASIVGKTIGASNFLAINIVLPVNATFTIDIWGVQLEAGSVATPFKRNASSLQGELAACQRYYWRSSATTLAYQVHGTGWAWNTANASVNIKNPVTMRGIPQSIDFSNLALTFPGSGLVAVTNVTNAQLSPDVASVNVAVASGLTTNQHYTLGNNNNAAGYIGFSAEL